MPITNSSTCGCTSTSDVQVCNSPVYTSTCSMSSAEMDANLKTLQKVRDAVCAIQNTGTPEKYSQVWDAFTGTDITITANSGQIPSDYAKISVFDGGVLLAMSDSLTTRDYLISGQTITFSETLTDTTIKVEFWATPYGSSASC